MNCAQIKKVIIIGIIILLPFEKLLSQNSKNVISDSSSIVHIASEPMEIDFLSGYYKQNGNHSAVTGGIGTEKLENFDSNIIINIPLDAESRLKVNMAINYYSSASTDNIDAEISSASANDYRAQVRVSYDHFDNTNGDSYEITAGGSLESDYISTMLGAKLFRNYDNGNRQFEFSAQALFDTWVLIFPEELRANLQNDISTDKRRTFSLSLNINQVISKRLQGSFSSDLVYQNGLLSTPFHRVYLKNNAIPKIEKLPEERFKFPIGLRLNYFINDFIIMRFYYRYYIDNFDIQANTFNLETPLKISKFFTLYPFYRFHQQTKSEYFEPIGEHLSDANYYTSDYDLSGLSSNKIGFGIKYAPLLGITHFKLLSSNSITSLKSISMRYSNFTRNDGLNSWLVSLGLSFISY